MGFWCGEVGWEACGGGEDGAGDEEGGADWGVGWVVGCFA